MLCPCRVPAHPASAVRVARPASTTAVRRHRSASGTNTGPIRDQPPSGQRVDFAGITLVAFNEAGQIAESLVFRCARACVACVWCAHAAADAARWWSWRWRWQAAAAAAAPVRACRLFSRHTTTPRHAPLAAQQAGAGRRAALLPGRRRGELWTATAGGGRLLGCAGGQLRARAPATHVLVRRSKGCWLRLTLTHVSVVLAFRSPAAPITLVRTTCARRVIDWRCSGPPLTALLSSPSLAPGGRGALQTAAPGMD
jgi:hypothetical protein